MLALKGNQEPGGWEAQSPSILEAHCGRGQVWALPEEGFLPYAALTL